MTVREGSLAQVLAPLWSVQIAATMIGVPVAMLRPTRIGNDPPMNARCKQGERGHCGKQKDDQPSFHSVPIPCAATSNLTSLEQL